MTCWKRPVGKPIENEHDSVLRPVQGVWKIMYVQLVYELGNAKAFSFSQVLVPIIFKWNENYVM